MNQLRRNPRTHQVTRHAAEQYVSRMAGNVSLVEARRRLQKIAQSSKRKRPAAGGATVYGCGGLELVMKDRTVITIYRAGTHRPAEELVA